MNQIIEQKKNINDFKPSTFILITGSTEEGSEDLPEVKQKIIRDVSFSIVFFMKYSSQWSKMFFKFKRE